MGMGWKTTGRSISSNAPCKCGSGEIIHYDTTEESDYPPFEREGTDTEYTCPNKCHLRTYQSSK